MSDSMTKDVVNALSCGNVIDEIKIIIKFVDGSKKTFGEDDVSENFHDWLSDINYDKKKELEQKFHGSRFTENKT
jgi:glutaredoxin 2